ncbi:N-acetylmuramoyl-L-alanine amidase [Paenibacillus sp. N1-5-1-14]|uniref:N-acetylmuramoyl-L-alanine amidase n=1 Tax=Paenibacillus radicibacter TaxID=2972488 RepID=UPI002158E235|nr:N-acetylmuramoyl-L-alanine amidase [Paenibacillus radicibacter]MCR8644149.1 N-acetylmuramoyl-L-alanine amidase [Paenibacillus radicibacter]
MKKASRALLLFTIFTLCFPSSAFALKVVVDPGHGGKDPGAIGVTGLQEKVVNLNISLKVRDELQRRGIEVIMTRESDKFLSLQERVNFTNRQSADLFVSIHANSHTNNEARGGLIMYYDNRYPQSSYPASPEMEALSPKSKKFAELMLQEYIKNTGVKNQGLMPSAAYVIRMGTIPSILVETAFLSNKADEELLKDEEMRSKMAMGVVNGILAYAGNLPEEKYPDLTGHWARDPIMRMIDKGWLTGYHNRFNPDRALTRAEFVSLMDRVFKFDKLPPQTGVAKQTKAGEGIKPPVFTDLEKDHWAYNSIMKGVELGAISGYPDGTLRPESPITRGEVAHLFHMLMQASTKTDETAAATKQAEEGFTFTDVPGDLWSAPAIYALHAAGIINGYTPTTFAPDRNMIRAEIAVVLDRYVAKP